MSFVPAALVLGTNRYWTLCVLGSPDESSRRSLLLRTSEIPSHTFYAAVKLDRAPARVPVVVRACAPMPRPVYDVGVAGGRRPREEEAAEQGASQDDDVHGVDFDEASLVNSILECT